MTPSATPNRLRLGLNAAYAAENRNHTIQDTQDSLNLSREINMTRRVNNVHTYVAPTAQH
jgi:hypothetical protein